MTSGDDPLAYQAEMELVLPVSVRLSICPSVPKHYLVRTITRHRFQLESPNLYQRCIMGYSQLVLKLGFSRGLLNVWIIDLDLQNKLAIWTPSIPRNTVQCRFWILIQSDQGVSHVLNVFLFQVLQLFARTSINGGLTKSPFKLWRWWLITSRCFSWMSSLL